VAELALYRKYRSGDFTEVVGQDHIVQTLTQALAAGRVSHAYLFTGPRGVGKTSVARLLAKGLNNKVDTASASLDIIEIDAASNRSIDAVRELRDKINLAPSVGDYKVYIIDEVHMLTTEAFNALLKTLEEPPAHAVFILATTEAHKVPETIISRTQRFNFKPIAAAAIVDRLTYIAVQEKIEVEKSTLELIAQSARGGIRDAISLMDQVAAGGNTIVTLQSVRDVLGYSDSETIGALAEAVAAGHTKEVLTHLDHLSESGVQPGQLIAQLIQWWRQLLLVTVGTETSSDPVVVELAANLSLAMISRVIESLIDASRSPWPALSLEVALVKMTARVERAATPIATFKPQAIEDVSQIVEDPGTSEMSDLWPKALMVIKTKNTNLYALLQSCRIEFKDDNLLVWSKFNFHRDRLMEAGNRQIIEKGLEKVYGRPISMTAHIDTTAKVARDPSAATPATDLVSSALEILGGEIVD
jgi:DNA polymerase-3 subunit gamma/tau